MRQGLVSIAFRRLVQSSHYEVTVQVRLGVDRLHCLSAFGSVVTRVPGRLDYKLVPGVSIAFRRLVQSSLAQCGQDLYEGGVLSPLPFGVWFSRHSAVFVGKHGRP